MARRACRHALRSSRSRPGGLPPALVPPSRARRSSLHRAQGCLSPEPSALSPCPKSPCRPGRPGKCEEPLRRLGGALARPAEKGRRVSRHRGPVHVQVLVQGEVLAFAEVVGERFDRGAWRHGWTPSWMEWRDGYGRSRYRCAARMPTASRGIGCHGRARAPCRCVRHVPRERPAPSHLHSGRPRRPEGGTVRPTPRDALHARCSSEAVRA